ncbi:hypothetical protein EVAR_43566_1 [Eumeta japonica]|uniref:Uncharacterized protein n=1 Tax=Eumeta variegata TaxID=151549 RepID=A0A4C1XH62_EUMVA|nr:hypothetical protein EVAR_43566_1 [Eumeta japonica]
MSALTRPDVLSEQEFLKAPTSLPCCTPRTRMTYRNRRPAFNSRYSHMIPRSIIGIGRTERHMVLAYNSGSNLRKEVRAGPAGARGRGRARARHSSGLSFFVGVMFLSLSRNPVAIVST